MTKHQTITKQFPELAQMSRQELEDFAGECMETVNYLRVQLKEINLLNSRLLYINKLFRLFKNLNAEQKMRLVDQFDACQTPADCQKVFRNESKNKETMK